MKKLLSISLTFLILLSGMHFTIATHYCGGKIAEIKLSFSGELATCGMETDKDYLLPGVNVETDCCQNRGSILLVDHNFSPSFTIFKIAPQNLLHVFEIPECIQIHSLTNSNIICTNTSPPSCSPVNAVSLPKICVFQI